MGKGGTRGAPDSLGDAREAISLSHKRREVLGTKKGIGVFQSPYSLVSMCKIINLKNGTSWKTLNLASTRDLKRGEMILICPDCQRAFIVQTPEELVINH